MGWRERGRGTKRKDDEEEENKDEKVVREEQIIHLHKGCFDSSMNTHHTLLSTVASKVQAPCTVPLFVCRQCCLV